MNSILQDTTDCFLCGKWDASDCHHIFGGSNRKWSEKYGLKVQLCRDCHDKVHFSPNLSKAYMDYLHRTGQRAFEQKYKDKDFIEIFGRNFL